MWQMKIIEACQYSPYLIYIARSLSTYFFAITMQVRFMVSG